MVRFCFWCVLVFSLLVNNAAAQNPFSVFDVFGGSEKKSDTSNEPTPANLDETAESPEVDRVEPIEQSGEDAPPFPQAKQAEKPQPEEPQPVLKPSGKAGAGEKPADSKNATKAATEELEELPQPEPQSVLKSAPKPATNSTTQPVQPVQPVQPASATVPESNVQPAAQVASGDAYLGASVKKRQQGSLGVEVTTVAPNSPAEAAGIRTGDVLITFAGTPVTSTGEFQELVELLVPGDRVELELMRGSKKEQTMVTLADSSKSVALNSSKAAPQTQTNSNVAPASDVSAAQPAKNLVVPADQRLMNQPETANRQTIVQQATVQRAQLGVVVVDGAEETRNGFRREVRTGAAVETVRANSPAARSGIPVGALIVAANGRRIETANDLVQYVDTLRPGQAVELIFYADSRQFKVSVTLAGSNELANSGQSVQPNHQYSQQQLQQQELLRQQQANQQNVRQATNFQPVPGNTGFESVQVQEVERPILKRFGERMPLLRRVDNMIDRLEQPALQDGVITETPRQVAPQSQSQDRQLEETIRQQQQQIEGLNRRLRELESRRRR